MLKARLRAIGVTAPLGVVKQAVAQAERRKAASQQASGG